MGALGFGATLALRQRGPGGAAFEFPGALPPGATLTRAGPAGRYDASGGFVVEAADVARFDHDPATLGLRGLLVEPQRTNAMLYSAQFDNAAGWTGATRSANQANAPDNSPSADLITTTSASGTASRVITTATAAPTMNGAATASVYLKAGNTTWIRINVGDSNAAGNSTINNGIVVWFNLATGQVGSVAYIADATAATTPPVGWTFVAAGMSPAANGFFRIWVAVTVPNTSVVLHMRSAAGNDTSTPFNAGSGAGIGATWYAWGAQLEAGAGATSHIATAGAPVTRAADVVTLDWGRLSVADGAVTIRYTFDDGSSQDVATTIAGGLAVVPTTLAASRLRRAQLI